MSVFYLALKNLDMDIDMIWTYGSTCVSEMHIACFTNWSMKATCVVMLKYRRVELLQKVKERKKQSGHFAKTK